MEKTVMSPSSSGLM